jgi:hypothetical protein
MDRVIALLVRNNGGHCVILDACGNILQSKVYRSRMALAEMAGCTILGLQHYGLRAPLSS